MGKAMAQVLNMVPTMGRIMARDEPMFYKKFAHKTIV